MNCARAGLSSKLEQHICYLLNVSGKFYFSLPLNCCLEYVSGAHLPKDTFRRRYRPMLKLTISISQKLMFSNVWHSF